MRGSMAKQSLAKLEAQLHSANRTLMTVGHPRIRRKQQQRIERLQRKIELLRTKKNPHIKTRKGKTNRWISGEAFKIVRKKGKLTVFVKR